MKLSREARDSRERKERMRRTLQRRLSRLETKAATSAHPSVLTSVYFVDTKPKPWEPNYAVPGSPYRHPREPWEERVWHREAGETSEEFETRVKADARRDKPFGNIAIYFSFKEDDDKPEQVVSS